MHLYLPARSRNRQPACGRQLTCGDERAEAARYCHNHLACTVRIEPGSSVEFAVQCINLIAFSFFSSLHAASDSPFSATLNKKYINEIVIVIHIFVFVFVFVVVE